MNVMVLSKQTLATIFSEEGEMGNEEVKMKCCKL